MVYIRAIYLLSNNAIANNCSKRQNRLPARRDKRSLFPLLKLYDPLTSYFALAQYTNIHFLYGGMFISSVRQDYIFIVEKYKFLLLYYFAVHFL